MRLTDDTKLRTKDIRSKKITKLPNNVSRATSIGVDVTVWLVSSLVG